MKLSVYSRGIWNILNLAGFLPEYELLFKTEAEAIAGWGYKPTSNKARAKALSTDKPYIALEDAFMRSYDLGVNGAAPLGLVVDDVGIYYDATKPSRLENLIIGFDDAELEKRAARIISEIKAKRLSKYNAYIEKWDKPQDKPIVLLLDQCEGDASIIYGMASADSFRHMVEKARLENPDAEILVKVHPDVVSGKRKGYIDLSQFCPQNIISQTINPHVLFEQVSKVYCVTSLSGFEALLHGLPVRCFGMPFYAGWGLTLDEFTIERRNVKRNLEQVFAAGYIQYSRYVNPYSGKACEIEEIINILTDVKSYYQQHQANYHCIGFSKWKRHFIKPYLKSPFNEIEFYRSEKAAIRAAQKGGAIVTWAARESSRLKERAGGISIYRMEDGFIRSVGLGSNFIAANSLVLDKMGIHFDYSKISGLEKIITDTDFKDGELKRAVELRRIILNKSITKYNIEADNCELKLPVDKRILLAIGQVESDASIRLGAKDIRTNQQLVSEMRRQNPEAFIIYKPHPELVAGNRKGNLKISGADITVTNMGIHSLLKNVDEVHVITSLVGFEALLQEKKVFVYGLPFYAGWGLTIDRHQLERRNRQISLDELTAAALLRYPSYYDFDANLPCHAEDIVKKFATSNFKPVRLTRLHRLLNGLNSVLR